MIDVSAINIAMELWGSLLSVLIAVYMLQGDRSKSGPSRAFVATALCNALLLFSDTMGFLLEGNPSFLHRGVVLVGNFLVFCLSYVLLLFFTCYLKSYLEETGPVSRVPLYINAALAAFSLILVFLSQFNHMYYIADADSIYIRGDMFWLSQCLGILGMLVNGVFLCVYSKRVEPYIKVVLSICIILPVSAMLIQVFSCGFALLNLANTISLIVLFLFVHINHADKESRLKKMLTQKSAELSASHAKLAQSRMALLKSQIQPHFIYNTLGTIGELCHVQPEKAAQIVQEFSLYLRGNFDELESNTPIRLSREIEHVKHYTAIERLRFPDMQIYFDLRSEDFLLPALSIQPLVENAIKHGLMGLESGGIVIISAFETEDTYCVCVQDDGVGFDSAEPISQSEHKHLGITNIRERLEIMCCGSLVIKSAPGRGTSATIVIPKEGPR